MALHQPSSAPSKGRVLVVEDEMMLMMMLEDILMKAGYAYVAASRMKKAVALAELEAVDCAILDVNVGGEEVYPVAEILTTRNIPFILTTGFGRQNIPSKYHERPILGKPYLSEQITAAIDAALQR